MPGLVTAMCKQAGVQPLDTDEVLPRLDLENFREFPWVSEAWTGETTPEDMESNSDTSHSLGP